MTYEKAIKCIRNICYRQGVCRDGVCKSTEENPCAIDAAIEAFKKLDKIRFIVNFEVGNRHEIGEKILDVIDGGVIKNEINRC